MVIVLAAIDSLNGNVEVLRFPAGSSREQVEKSGTFLQNNGNRSLRRLEILGKILGDQ
jgi:hypothetical protein